MKQIQSINNKEHNGSSIMNHQEPNVPYDILKLLGPEKASELFMGEPVKDMDAWILLDISVNNTNTKRSTKMKEGKTPSAT